MSAFTLDMRTYDKSMLGVIGANTPDSDKVGVVRQLSYNPNIINVRGMIDTSKDNNELDAFSMMTPSELLSPFTNTHADGPRIGMQVTQSKHIIPTKKSSKALYGTGVEKTIPHILGSDFIVKAKNDGKVKLYDETKEIMILEYKDKSIETIDLSSIQAKNSNGGFYLTTNKIPLYKQGQSFKKGDIIAKNEDYFKGDKSTEITYTPGCLTKIALTSGDYTLEDSSIITSKLSDDMSSNITMKKEIGGLGPNINIISYKRKGDSIKTGEALFVYEQSFDEKAANELLDSLSSDIDDVLEDLGKNKILSKYTGKIVDVKMYWNKDLEEMSPSIQKIIKEYIKDINDRKKILGDLQTKFIFPPTVKISKDKIGNNELDGLYIEYYIQYNDTLGIGDKISFETALKTVVCDVIDEGEEPYAESTPDESIDAILSPLSVVSRMTMDIYSKMYINKSLIEMKKKIKDIWK